MSPADMCYFGAAPTVGEKAFEVRSIVDNARSDRRGITDEHGKHTLRGRANTSRE